MERPRCPGATGRVRDSRDVTEHGRIHREQAAFRRLATLVARQASQTELFRAIAEESDEDVAGEL